MEGFWKERVLDKSRTHNRAVRLKHLPRIVQILLAYENKIQYIERHKTRSGHGTENFRTRTCHACDGPLPKFPYLTKWAMAGGSLMLPFNFNFEVT
jgi:hypothetical protein